MNLFFNYTRYPANRKNDSKDTGYLSGVWRIYYTGFTAVSANLDKNGREGPESIGSHYKGQDHDGQVTLSSGIQLWTVPHTSEYRTEAIGAPGVQ